MNSIAINREIILGRDFGVDFDEYLCDYLNELIDAELAKGDSADFDLIDEYADAINYIMENGVSEIIPVISNRDFMKKLGIRTGTPAFKIAVAIAAAAALMVTGASLINSSRTDIIAKTAEYFRGLFGAEETIESDIPEATEITSVTEKETTAAPVKASGIRLEFDADFKSEYYVGESFDKKGLRVYLIYDNGKTPVDNYSVITVKPFAIEAGEQEVTVSASGFSESFSVRILNSVKTPTLNSIYASFPEDFDFTYSGDPEEMLKNSGMRVYAVFSDGTEKELESGEYTVTIKETKRPLKTSAEVRIEYRGCVSAFVIKGVYK